MIINILSAQLIIWKVRLRIGCYFSSGEDFLFLYSQRLDIAVFFKHAA